MSSTSSPTLLRDVHSRHTERRVAVLALTGGGLTPFLTALPGVVSVVCALASMLVIWAGFWRAGWVAADHRIVALSWLTDGRWLLTDRRGRTVEGRLRPESRVGCRAVWLHWDVTGRSDFRRQSLLLAGGDIPDSDLRRLMVRLRIEGHQSQSPDNMSPSAVAREISIA